MNYLKTQTLSYVYVHEHLSENLNFHLPLYDEDDDVDKWCHVDSKLIKYVFKFVMFEFKRQGWWNGFRLEWSLHEKLDLVTFVLAFHKITSNVINMT